MSGSANTEVEEKAVTIWSEGSRLAANIFRPQGNGSALPAILLCHGWGGLKSHLAKYARAFANNGFIALVFDYRGWGESDGKIIPTKDLPMLTEVGVHTLKVRVIREVVDPQDQHLDIRAAFAYLASEEGVDPNRLAIWGSSYGGGHAVYAASLEPRIKAVVAQIGGFDHPHEDWYFKMVEDRARDRARGLIDPPIPQGIDTQPGLSGTPDAAKTLGYRPLKAAENIRVPTLIIDAENEELLDRHKHGEAVYRVVSQNVPSEYITYPCRHYEVYDKYFEPAVESAIGWYRKFLK